MLSKQRHTRVAETLSILASAEQLKSVKGLQWTRKNVTTFPSIREKANIAKIIDKLDWTVTDLKLGESS